MEVTDSSYEYQVLCVLFQLLKRMVLRILARLKQIFKQ